MFHRLALLAFAPVAFAVAQTTYVVPTGADLAPFIAAAVPGDTLQLGSSHPAFTLNKGLHLMGAATTIVDNAGNTQTNVVVPAGQRASLASLTFTGGLVQYPNLPRSPDVHFTGDVLVEGCSCTSLYHYSVTVHGGTVLLRQCTLAGNSGGVALTVLGGFCSLSRSTATGGPAGQLYMGPTFSSKPGVLQTGGVLWIDGSTLGGGGWGLIYSQPLGPSPALSVQGGTCRVVDSQLTGGAGVQGGSIVIPGGAAIASSGSCSYARGVLTGGGGPVPGPATTGNVVLAPELVGLQASGPLVLGGSTTLTATAGTSQQLLAIAASLQPGVAAHPLAAQPVLGGGVGLMSLAFVAAPAPGALVTVGLTIPNVAALRGTGLLCQALQWQAGLVQVSTFVGGAVQ